MSEELYSELSHDFHQDLIWRHWERFLSWKSPKLYPILTWPVEPFFRVSGNAGWDVNIALQQSRESHICDSIYVAYMEINL